MENPSASNVIAGRYEFRRALGSGGGGTVFQAWDTQLHRFVAVKRWNQPEAIAGDRAGTERLWREAMTLAAIQHPNILTIHDFGVDAVGPYVITEFVDGETLNHVIQEGAFERDTFADAAQQILEGLIAAHQAGLIHRDLKPQNIMRTRLPSGAWQYKILDFGLARFVSRPTLQSMEGNTSIYGSIYYIAPEQLRHQPLDARTDLYALGCLCYYMLSGRNAFEGETIPELITSHLDHQPQPLAELRPDLPPGVCEWVMKAMAFAPDDRFASAAEALAALRRALAGGTLQAPIRIARAAPAAPFNPIQLGQAKSPAPAPTIVIPAPSPITAPIPAAGPPQATVTIPVSTPVILIPRWALIAALALGLGTAGLLLLRRPAAPAPAAAAAAETIWPAEAVRAEEVIRVWPPYIAVERRPLLQHYYDQMRGIQGPHWGSIGTILEFLAVQQLNAGFDPAEFQALCNLTYHDEAGRTLGELDVVVWNLREHRAEIVYEATISDQIRRKGTVSRNQLKRFETALREGQVRQILYPYDPAWKFEPAQFTQTRYGILGNQGALEAGFDIEVDITRTEADFLQLKLLAYRDAQAAAAPQKKKAKAAP